MEMKVKVEKQVGPNMKMKPKNETEIWLTLFLTLPDFQICLQKLLKKCAENTFVKMAQKLKT